ncbi:helix-turn-helix transcriptional regulator [Actinoplanes sp. L3-i22]|uniref:helix-turn-helix domain-containing protein n=1 Tax=Actinoplanes sp. L3-i22 TaxID=2836373 RepID=UPI001C765631|nr:helix-turn-helix transcriptional regulator [Actinoplanes sp. L3-i22]BCY11806.1 transcriptional regulator [Actinoplanes sp. L3-i22]
MPTPLGPTVRRRQVGSALRHYRTEAGLSVQDVAELLLCSPAKISRIETAQRNPTLRDVRDLLRIFGVTDARVHDRLMSMTRESRDRGWWQTLNLPPGFEVLIGMERAATHIKEFEIMAIPGLLQTREYATEITFPVNPDERQSRVDVRMRRQQVLKESAPRFTVILDEAAIHRLVGGAEIFKKQLDHLIHMIDSEALELFIIPFSAGVHAGMLNGFTLLEFGPRMTNNAEPDIDPVVYIEYHQTDTMSFDETAVVDEYTRTFTTLRNSAHSQRASRGLILSAIETS